MTKRELFAWCNASSKAFLQKDYLLPNQTVTSRVRDVGNTAEGILGISGFSDRVFECVAKGWFSLSTPIWVNFGTDRGLPISCYGSTCMDTTESILYTQAEVSMMTKKGGGTSVYLGNLRPRGAVVRNNGYSSGSAHFAQLFENDIKVWSQGSTRRGNCAVYQDIEHPDAMEFLNFRLEGSPVQDLSYGICISDAFMEGMIQGDVKKRELWAKVLENRFNTGYPYIFFKGNANTYAPDVYRDRNLLITHTNLCTEIMEPDGEDESFVCDLLSLNDLYFDEWKDTHAVETATFLLDAVMTEFIKKGESVPFLSRAVRFAKRHRALGLGQLGWHSYLQSKRIPFEGMEAKTENVKIARHIREAANEASRLLAKKYGEPELLKGYNRRNSVLIALAPTKSSAFILGQASESTEPFRSNYHVDDKAKQKFTFRNPYLEEVLTQKGMNKEEVWGDILLHGGSVQHLSFLDDREKAVFKTFREISPLEVVQQAAQRQKWIDQGQSTNLLIDPRTSIKDVNALYVEAWKLGLKSLYYQISVNASQEFSRSILKCTSCEA